MKSYLKYLLQKMFGFDNYLFLFSIMTIKALKINKYEKEFLYFIDLIPEEGTILDIGANIGITSVPLAQRKKKSFIYAFEPMPENISALKRVIQYFKLSNVKILETALGDIPGELKMVMPVINNVKMQGFSHIISESDAKDHDQTHIHTVPVNTLDKIEELNVAAKISAIKIDVEGFEYFVLKGGCDMLSKHKPLIYCELWDNEKRKMTIDYLLSLGYEVKFLDGNDLKLYKDNPNIINFFFSQV